MELSRRTFLGTVLGGASCCIRGLAPWSALGATLPAPTALHFDAYHGKSKIGVHHVAMVPDGDGLKVTTSIDMGVSLAFIKLFGFKHDAVERWKDGRLASIESSTNDDGDKINVSGAATHGGVLGISVQRLGTERVKAAGAEHLATKYKLITPYLGGVLWYDDTGRWVKALYEKDGEKIDCRLAA